MEDTPGGATLDIPKNKTLARLDYDLLSTPATVLRASSNPSLPTAT